MSNSRFRNVALGGMALLSAVAVVDGVIVEPRRMVAPRHTVAVRGLAPSLDGMTIAHLSDLHVGARHARLEAVARGVEVANRAQPDLVVLTGDFADSHAGTVRCAEQLAGLRAPCGVVAVLGNHDHYGGPRRAELVVRALESAGVQVLRNSVCRVERNGASLWVAGVDDARVRRADLAGTLARLPQGAGPRILLAHYPDVADGLAEGQVDLVLSGHTHGGQINVPLLGRAAIRQRARSRYGAGLYRIHGTPLLISRGIATIGVPVRLNCVPEVPIVRLVSAP